MNKWNVLVENVQLWHTEDLLFLWKSCPMCQRHETLLRIEVTTKVKFKSEIKLRRNYPLENNSSSSPPSPGDLTTMLMNLLESPHRAQTAIEPQSNCSQTALKSHWNCPWMHVSISQNFPDSNFLELLRNRSETALKPHWNRPLTHESVGANFARIFLFSISKNRSETCTETALKLHWHHQWFGATSTST